MPVAGIVDGGESGVIACMLMKNASRRGQGSIFSSSTFNLLLGHFQPARYLVDPGSHTRLLSTITRPVHPSRFYRALKLALPVRKKHELTAVIVVVVVVAVVVSMVYANGPQQPLRTQHRALSSKGRRMANARTIMFCPNGLANASPRLFLRHYYCACALDGDTRGSRPSPLHVKAEDVYSSRSVTSHLSVKGHDVATLT